MAHSVSSFLVSRYGGKKAFLINEWQRVQGLLGVYRQYRRIDFEHVKRLVFVCQGNICRSPFAECYARDLGLESKSFGLIATTGSAANELGVAVAAKAGVELSSHQATNVQDFVIRADDLLVGFEPFHCRKLEKCIPPGSPAQVSLAGMWLAPPRPYIHDPYGAPEEYFVNCYQRIINVVSRLVPLLPNCRNDR